MHDDHLTDAPNIQPIVVYRLANLPAAMYSNVAPDSPLFQCCFYSAVAGATTSSGVSAAFANVPEPACVAEPGMSIAKAVHAALTATGVGMMLFAGLSKEQPVKKVLGFHAGDAVQFRHALQAAGLTLLEGSDIFRTRMRLVLATRNFVQRLITGGSVVFIAAHPVDVPTTPNQGNVYAYWMPSAESTSSLLGVEGGIAVDLPGTTPDAVMFADVLDVKIDDAGPLTTLLPRSVRVQLGAEPIDGPTAAGLIEWWVHQVIALPVEQQEILARLWVTYLLSDTVTGHMGLFGNAIIGSLNSLVGADFVADLVVEANHRPH